MNEIERELKELAQLTGYIGRDDEGSMTFKGVGVCTLQRLNDALERVAELEARVLPTEAELANAIDSDMLFQAAVRDDDSKDAALEAAKIALKTMAERT